MTMLALIGAAGHGARPDPLLLALRRRAAHAPLWNGPVFTTLPDLVFLLIGFSNAIFITAPVRLQPHRARPG